MHLLLRALTIFIVIRGLEAPFMVLYSLIRAVFEAPRERAPNFV
jgi:hypothetical protein